MVLVPLQRGGPQAPCLYGRQPLLREVGGHREFVRGRVGAGIQGHELLAEVPLGVLAGPKAAFGSLPAATVGSSFVEHHRPGGATLAHAAPRHVILLSAHAQHPGAATIGRSSMELWP
jgi:hypothetical protein